MPHDAVLIVDLAGEDLSTERGLELLLQQPLERARAVDRVVAGVREVLERRVGELDLDLALRQPRPQPAELDLDDLLELLARQAVEDDDLVDAVEELGPEVLAQRLEHLALHALVGLRVVAAAVARG